MARKRKKSKAKVEPREAEPSQEEETPPKDVKSKKRGSKKRASKKSTSKKPTSKKRDSKKRDSKKREEEAPSESSTEPETSQDLGSDVTDVEVDVYDLEVDDSEETLKQLLTETLALDDPTVKTDPGTGLDAEEEVFDRDAVPEGVAQAPAAEEEVFDLDEDLKGIGRTASAEEVPGPAEAESVGHEQSSSDGDLDMPNPPEPMPPEVDDAAAAAVALAAIQLAGFSQDVEEAVLELGEVSEPEDRERLLAAALAHADMQEAMYRVPTDTGQAHRWKGTIASIILVIALVVSVSPPGLLVPDPPARLNAGDRLHGVRVTLLLQAEQIAAFRVREQRLPASLREVAVTFPGVRFVRSSNRVYQLIAYTADGEAVVYDSAAPGPEFGVISRTFAFVGTGS